MKKNVRLQRYLNFFRVQENETFFTHLTLCEYDIPYFKLCIHNIL